jgi:hypothetical protein
MAAIYAGSPIKPHNRSRPATSLGWRLGSLDMSVPLVLRAGHDVDLTELLDRWKGPSGYGLRGAGDLRQVWPSANRCVSLVHSPDSRELLLRDVAVLFGEQVVRRLDSGEEIPAMSADSVSQLRMYRPMADEPHPYDIALRTLVRGMALLGYDARLDTLPQRQVYERQIARILAFRQQLTASLAAGHTVPDQTFPLVVGELERVRRALPLQPPRAWADAAAQWQDRLLRARRGALVAVLQGLTDPVRWSETAAEEVIDVFAGNGLAMEPWERHLLGTALAFGPHG